MRQLLTGVLSLFLFVAFISCQKEVSLEFGSPARGSLRSDVANDCLPKTVAGTYAVNKVINDSNFIEVSVAVAAPGPYTIVTDTVNGYSFKATGTFTASGNNTVRLKGTGRPIAAGTDDFIVVFDTTFCTIQVTVLPTGSTGGPAAFTLQGAGSACGNFAPQGTYYKDTTLDARHKVSFQVNVTTVGTYTIRTDTVNGYYFFKTGTFGATGLQTVTLDGVGKPLATGTNTFTVKTGTQTCTFPITVLAGGTTPPGSCGTAGGTYTVGTALGTSNTITISHTYAATGTYTVNPGGPQTGYGFSSVAVNATGGTATSITLTGSGTPTTAGTNTFTVNFGDGTSCTFTVTVNPATTTPNTDYFPTTQASYWTYSDSIPTDTFKVVVNGTTTFSGSVYQNFTYSGLYTGNEYYRKNAANGFYYQSIDTVGAGPDLVFANSRLNILFMKNTLTTGATWNHDEQVTFGGVLPGTLRYEYTCLDANGTLTINGKTFTNVYEVERVIQIDFGAGFEEISTRIDYYARGVGLIATEDDNGAYVQSIRFWQVN